MRAFLVAIDVKSYLRTHGRPGVPNKKLINSNTYQPASLIIVQIHQFAALLFGQLIEALLFLAHVDEWLAESGKAKPESNYLIKSRFFGAVLWTVDM